MALRVALGRRFLCTSTISSQFSASLAAVAAESARNNPAPIPSDTLFVSGLNKRTTNEKLHEAFSKFGQIATDRNSGYSKGYGFVKYASVEEAAKGIKGMDAKFLEGWVIFAVYARPRPPPGQDRPQDANGAWNRWRNTEVLSSYYKTI